MQFQDLAERLTTQLDEFRDRTAETVRADSDSVFREIGQLGRRIDGAEKTLLDRIDALDRDHASRWDAMQSRSRRTTWPRRLLWLGLGVAAGMVAAYLGDPERGRSRRAQYGEQLTARVRDVASKAANQARMAVDRTRGQMIEGAKDMMGEDVPSDPRLLEQRIKSDVFGHRDDVADVVIRVDGPGQIALKGTVPTPRSEAELMTSVAEVEGVLDVRSELAVRSSG